MTLLNGTDLMSDDANPHQEIDDLLFKTVELLDLEKRYDYQRVLQGNVKIVLKILNVIWRTQACPREWRTGVIIPIYKAGEEADTNNYRGITLLNTLYKIMTTMIAAGIQDWAEQEGIITEN
uniref:Reverse transcriptase domain-containing protein n=1 Tax=Strigamia maritima TaxID=126957 RepID=T1J6V9_STRMM